MRRHVYGAAVRTSEVDKLLDDIATQVGLQDFGDPSFRDGLENVLTSAEQSAQLTALGSQVLEGTVRASLRNRLRVTDWHRSHPEAGRQPVDVPIIIVGLARSGTTALSHLLGADAANRSLLGWEAGDCVPPPTTATYASDPRFLAAQSAPRVLDHLNPGFRAIHEDPPDQPVECAVPLAQHFTSLALSTMFNVPAYDEWLLQTDLTAAYAWHRKVLQLLQFQCPGPWQLKSPVHCYAIDTVAATYPDALFVMPHRDPVKCLASTCSTVLSLSGTFTAADHRAAVAERWPQMTATMLERIVSFRERNGDSRFLDVPYADIVRDPVEVVRTIYTRIGRELSPETEGVLRAHVAKEPQHLHGKHAYSLQEFGLRREPVEELLSGYMARFDVPREDV
jgi:Sulfotransferase family